MTALILAAAFHLQHSAILHGTTPIPAHVTRVVDGDGLWLSTSFGAVDVRVLGLDCPENSRNRKCMHDGRAACDAQLPRGRAAKDRAVALLVGDVTLVPDQGRGFFIDRYQRTVASIRLPDGRDFAAIMIAEGRCVARAPTWRNARHRKPAPDSQTIP